MSGTNRRWVATALAVLLAAGALLLAGCAKKADPAGGAAGGAAAGAADPQNAAAGGTEAAADGKHVDAFGVVRPKIAHTVTIEFPAVVEKKLVAEGQRVKRGEVLFRISRPLYDAQLKDKGYELAAARLELKKAGLDVQKLREQLSIAQDDADRAQADLASREKALSVGAASRSDVDVSRGTVKARQQAVRDLARSIEEYDGSDVNGMEVRTTKIALLEEELQRLEQQSDRPYLSADQVVCDVRDGVVNEIGYADGDVITRERKLCSIIDLDSLVVEANIPEEFIKDVKLGSRASVVPVADNARTYEGKVTRVANLAVKNNGETVIPVEITLDAADGFLLPNFNVDVSIR